jgi:hypothetical protein
MHARHDQQRSGTPHHAGKPLPLLLARELP